MAVAPVTLARTGAWGQLAALALAGFAWSFGLRAGLYVASFSYLLLTVIGILGIVKGESVPTAGPLVFPFVLPGFVPLYYFGTQL